MFAPPTSLIEADKQASEKVAGKVPFHHSSFLNCLLHSAVMVTFSALHYMLVLLTIALHWYFSFRIHSRVCRSSSSKIVSVIKQY